MTREEARKELESMRMNLITAETSEWMSEKEKRYIDACEMAIKALEQEPVLDKVKAEIKEWYWQADKQVLAKDPCVVDAMIDLFIRTINKYKAESGE